jgi:hypothetical protein
MAKLVPDETLDRALSPCSSATFLTVCANQPTNGSAAMTTYMLASHAITAADWTFQNGVTNGRRLTIAAQANIPVTTAGSAQHVCVVTTAAASSALQVVTTCDSQYLYTTGSVTIPTWDWELADVTA